VLIAIVIVLDFCAITDGYGQPKYLQHKVFTGQLTPDQFSQVKQYIFLKTHTELKDTLFITYQRNNMDCWYHLESWSIERRKQAIDFNNGYADRQLAERPNISIYFFKEKGEKFPLFIKENSKVLVDTEGVLLKMFFSKKANGCGGLIIFPDGKFLLLQVNRHFEIISFSSEAIDSFLVGKDIAYPFRYPRQVEN
jgi:hypothetical protein